MTDARCVQRYQWRIHEPPHSILSLKLFILYQRFNLQCWQLLRYVASSNTVTSKLCTENCVEGKSLDPISATPSKLVENHYHDIWSPGRYLNSEPANFDAGVLTAWQRSSVKWNILFSTRVHLVFGIQNNNSPSWQIHYCRYNKYKNAIGYI